MSNSQPDIDQSLVLFTGHCASIVDAQALGKAQYSIIKPTPGWDFSLNIEGPGAPITARLLCSFLDSSGTLDAIQRSGKHGNADFRTIHGNIADRAALQTYCVMMSEYLSQYPASKPLLMKSVEWGKVVEETFSPAKVHIEIANNQGEAPTISYKIRTTNNALIKALRKIRGVAVTPISRMWRDSKLEIQNGGKEITFTRTVRTRKLPGLGRNLMAAKG